MYIMNKIVIFLFVNCYSTPYVIHITSQVITRYFGNYSNQNLNYQPLEIQKGYLVLQYVRSTSYYFH